MFVAVAEVQRAGAAEAPRGSKSAQRKGSAGRFATHSFCEVVRHVLGGRDGVLVIRGVAACSLYRPLNQDAMQSCSFYAFHVPGNQGVLV